MAKTTCLRNIDWLVAWSEPDERHVYRRGADVAFCDDTIIYVGSHFEGAVDVEIDASECFVLPGFIDVHSHPSTEPAQIGVREEHCVADMHMSSLYQRSVVFKLDAEGRRAAIEVAYADLLSSGVTTLADLSFPFEGWMETAARSGLRMYLAPGFASAAWKLESEHWLEFDWDEDAGQKGFEEALTLIESAQKHACGRLSGMLYPAQIDTCSESLLKECMQAADRLNLPITTHAAQSVPEFNLMVRRHGKTPIQWAHDIGILQPRMTIGHALFVDEHSWLSWASDDDVGLLASTGVSVAHCPTPFSRYGQVLEDFGRYRRAGINLAIGTDCAPHNIIEEMRTATVLSHIGARNMTTASAADILHAATVGGAKALLRDDIGKIEANCKADLVLVDLTAHCMQPVRDPLRSLVFHAAERAVRDVYVGGQQVVANAEVTTLDRATALTTLAGSQERMLAGTSARDYRGRGADEISPLSLPLVH